MSPMTRPLLLCSLFLTAVSPARAQDAATEVRQVIDHLFDGMRRGDSTAVRMAFHPKARLISVAQQNGQTLLNESVPEPFIKAVGTPHDAVWDERISNVVIYVDGDLATAWMDYAFYLGDRLSHCGVNAFQLVREHGVWRTIHLMDTRRREGCWE